MLLEVAPDEAETVEALLGSLDQWATGRVDAARIDREHRIPPHLIEELAEMGLFGLSIPERFGGAGMSLRAVCDLVGGLAQLDRSIATTVGLHLGLGTRGLVRFGDEALQERILPDLATGARIAAFAATEPGAGSDLTAVSTRAVRRDGALVVDGAKVFVTNGGMADVFTLLVSSPDLGRKSQSLVLLERGDEGLSVGPEEDKLGLRGSSTTSLHLDEVRVGEDRVIGTPGRGQDHVAHVLAWGRTAMAAGATGAARAALDLALSHTAQRRQFGRPLAELPVVRAQLADLAAICFAMEALVRHTAADEEALPWRSTLAKVFCSEGDWEVCDTALQLHGGMGFVEETGIALLLRDARITRIFEGANDVLLVHAGLGALRCETGDSAPGRALAERREHLLATHGMRLVRRHRDLHQLGRLAVLAEACRAAAQRAADDDTARARALSDHFHALAAARIRLEDPPDVDLDLLLESSP